MFKKLIDKNFRKPGGLIGRYIIRFLKKNQIEYDEMDALLRLNKNDVVLEIGYGLGKGIYDYAQKYECTFHGIDFSRLMYEKARKLNREHIKRGKVILQCADFDSYAYENDIFDCVYFLNVIYFWDEIQSRLKKIYSILKPKGKVIIFMADAACFKDIRQTSGKKIFNLYSIDQVMQEMGQAGFTNMETIEHTKEKQCYYLIGYKINTNNNT
ncbi:MAG TPA: class I SAM-dependent methyltransferase [Bacteroidales bacterium]|nr:class I SAM-dependent methyltransferase [Bacteroidales bacterium]HQI69754.1 class I SAM-dependent methyltransferase [Bacteroidales bacterium]